MKELYDSAITDPSLQELEVFAKWYNDTYGNCPIIVGGWAVYCYTKGLGSKDIDVVFLSDQLKHSTLSAYFQTHGYKERRRTFFDKEFVKFVKPNNLEIEIIIDAVSANRTIIFEGKKARLPWQWAVKHNQLHTLGKAAIYIPSAELLIVYKLGAILGRNINLKTGIDYDYYRSKLWKDAYDILSLASLQEFIEERAGKFAEQAGMLPYAQEIMDALRDNINDETRQAIKTSDAALEKVEGILAMR